MDVDGYEQHEWPGPPHPLLVAWLERIKKRTGDSPRIWEATNAGDFGRGDDGGRYVVDETGSFARGWLNNPRKASKANLTEAMQRAAERREMRGRPTVDPELLGDPGPGGEAERARIRAKLEERGREEEPWIPTGWDIMTDAPKGAYSVVTVYDCELGCLAEITTPDGRKFYGFDGAAPPR